MRITSVLLIILSVLELSLITYIGVNIFNKKRVLGTLTQVTPLPKENYETVTQNHLKYFYEPKPNNTIILKPDWLPSISTQTINKDSLNERYDYSFEKPINTYRIVALGDSFTNGYYVNTQDNYPEQLEDLLSKNTQCKNIAKFEVINLGVGGYDIEYALERLSTRGIKYNPDLLLWFIKQDDIYQINEKIKAKSDIYKQEMKKNGEIEKYRQKGEYYPWTNKALKELEKEWDRVKMELYQKSVLNSLNKIYEGKLLMFTFPFINDHAQTFLTEFTNSRSNTFFYKDIPDIYALKQYLPDRHPTKNGYTLIAQNLFTYLTKHIIPCVQ